MGYVYYNANPMSKTVGDCVIRSIAIALDYTWERVYSELLIAGFLALDMPSSNAVWGSYLKGKGFVQKVVQADCPDCVTVRQFAAQHPFGTYVLATGSHAVAVQQGNYIDNWDSGDEIVTYYFEKERR